MQQCVVWGISILLLYGLTSCSEKKNNAEKGNGDIKVMATTTIIANVVEEVAGDYYNVETLISASASCISWFCPGQRSFNVVSTDHCSASVKSGAGGMNT